MKIEQLVGSMLMFGFRGGSLSDPETRQDIDELKEINAGGVILFDRDIAGNSKRNIHTPKQLTKLIDDLRNEMGSDLIVAIDQEGGTVSRLDENHGFLPTMSAEEFAAHPEMDQDQYANRQARQLRELGINLNFAPCVDLAIDPHSPIIAGKNRSFGLDAHAVSRCAQRVIDAHRTAGVRCCIKHFPGHGSAMLDSHLGVCDVTKTHTEEETNVFRELILLYADRISVMSGHLMDTRIDPSMPASISAKHTCGVLREQLGFDGVVVTDSLDMRAIRDQFGGSQAAIHAINAGADLILDGINGPGYREPGAPSRMASSVIQAIEQGNVEGSHARIEASRARIDYFMNG